MSTDEVVPKDRADWYQDVVSRTVAPHILAIDDPAGFRARTCVLSLGQVEVSRHSHAAHRAWRTPALIRRSDPEHYLLGMIVHGRRGSPSGAPGATWRPGTRSYSTPPTPTPPEPLTRKGPG
ncbi:hypothetical protein ACFWYW_38080 [Nonomuraea sp. NPDC059023]|uniref:AraC-like ligand-binding domain-containing protein n=1 Tax=unclassified Nonomuraea TaxID=2593643 RepID=UPI00369FE560